MNVLPMTELRPYTLVQLRQMLQLSRHAILRLVELGFVHPQQGPNRTLNFSFRDMVLLKSANDLREAGIPTRQILRSLRDLKQSLPVEQPLSDLRVLAVGERIAVRRAGDQATTPWDAGSGQLLMDFRVDVASGEVTRLRSLAAESPADRLTYLVETAYRAAEALEDTDSAAAELAYRQVLAATPTHAHALLNLGFMLCESGRFQEAADLYSKGSVVCPDDPLIHYNHGVAMQALGHFASALSCYEQSLLLQPDLADAHQNAALLYSEVGEKQMAIRHFSAYRRLQRRP
ncbi:tetratricopeptide repeat protein [Polaromonas sp.]|uniref:tetratricopeptide repeat protein n=1 Tax=Polaromonas sp. TaxID=1869339 RepID=UPI00352A1E4F